MIIVLGVLALMMVLGVAFSVTMRVERAGAGNYASTVNTRQVVWAGLARAIADINAATTNYYPGWDYLPASGSEVNLASGKALDYVPDVLRPVAEAVRSDWVRLRPEEGMGGHVAYLVLNVSDMLDANHVGGAVREGGTNVAEIVLDGINWSKPFNVATMVGEREGSGGPFESLPEFTARTGLPNDVLVAYSRYLQDTNRTSAYYIGTTVAEIEAQEGGNARNITRLLLRLRRNRGLAYVPSPADSQLMFSYLLDYVDTDIEPRRLDGPNGKAVPLLNEVAARESATYRLVAPALQLTVVPPPMRIETWFPFFKPATESFKVHWDQRTTLMIGTNAVVQTNSYESASYSAVTNDFELHQVAALPPRFNVVITTNDASFQLHAEVRNLRVALAADVNVLVDSATNMVFTFISGPVNIIHSGMNGQVAMSPVTYQVSDPRLNWLTNSWVSSANNTIGGANPGQAGKRIHASNSGILYSPLELGHLLMPRNPTPGPAWVAWDTLQVFKEGGWRDPLLETFTTDTNTIRRGLVNANTLDPEILATALRDMPHPYVGGPPLDLSVLASVQDLFQSAHTNGTFFSFLTDALELDWPAALPALSDPEREAIAAHSTGLMGVRQSLFLVFVSGSAAEEGLGIRGQQTVRTQARKTAVALVWRDPVANAQGLHDCFVRYFKWLDD